MQVKKFAKKFSYLFCGYVVIYFFTVVKMYSSNGGYHWNLFSYFGTLPTLVVTIAFFIFGFWVTKYENYL